MMSIVMDGSQASGSASMIVMAAANGPLIVSDHISCSQMGCNHRLLIHIYIFSLICSGLWFVHPDPVGLQGMDLQTMAMSFHHE